ncbi:transcriptional regulator [Candidatus Nitrososphaera evergladensis SR1]|jgi:DNA-binding Lrp family transcriptional regulator|uniref:Transcriptional regulator n=1 Tax=Candidatus Nitrososphaera evergladensis SR1 TaxID=1459636 RepID=A0A075MUU6_9ARCH|nr:AsnC family transcriptional regulator [Candidatus Nitrososphaera evergladensis]AIF84442.1 transcriptional regulator [Candidatus Nitrososphaera evergladensis SR1]
MKSPIALTEIDRKILKSLIAPKNVRASSKTMSEQLGIPQTTLQRRRKKLEEFTSNQCFLNLSKFGWRKVEFFLSTNSGKTMDIARILLQRDEVMYVSRNIGERTIDLRVKTIVRTNAEIASLLEEIKSIEGVRDAVWTETVQVIGKKDQLPDSIISQL